MHNYSRIRSPENASFAVIAQLVNGYLGATQDFETYDQLLDTLRNFVSEEVMWLEIRLNYRHRGERRFKILLKWSNLALSYDVPNVRELKTNSISCIWSLRDS